MSTPIFGIAKETSPVIEAISYALTDTKKHATASWYAGEPTVKMASDRNRIYKSKARITRPLEINRNEFINIINLAWSHTGESNRQLLEQLCHWLGCDGVARGSRQKNMMLNHVISMALYMAAEDWPPSTFPKQRWPTSLADLTILLQEHSAS